MNNADPPNEPTLVERWLHDQQEWQRTLLSFLDSAVKNDDFLVHLGNALRGSLLAGKAYPTAPLPGVTAPQTPADDRLDQVLFALRQLQGQMADVLMTLDEIRNGREAASLAGSPAVRPSRPARTKRKAVAGASVQRPNDQVQE